MSVVVASHKFIMRRRECDDTSYEFGAIMKLFPTDVFLKEKLLKEFELVTGFGVRLLTHSAFAS